jgi:hypothetical protein
MFLKTFCYIVETSSASDTAFSKRTVVKYISGKYPTIYPVKIKYSQLWKITSIRSVTSHTGTVKLTN